MKKQGVFITFEGPEGAGKTTQINLLAERIIAMGREVVKTREPGGTPLAEGFRNILKHHNCSERIQPYTEVLLFEAGRIQNISEVIKPALESGKVVLCDRFIDSTVAYQGYGRGVDIGELHHLNRLATQDVKLDMTILLDLPTEAGFLRTTKRTETMGEFDRMEAESLAFHHRVRQGFLTLAEEAPERIKKFDAELPAETLAEAVFNEVVNVLR